MWKQNQLARVLAVTTLAGPAVVIIQNTEDIYTVTFKQRSGDKM